MFIPKGTICMPNVWHMNRDPEIFGGNTEHFDPARYLDAHGEISTWGIGIQEGGALFIWSWEQKLRWAPCARQLAFHQHCGVTMGNKDRT